MIDRQAKEVDQKSQKAIEEFLAKGNKITVCPPGARTENLEFKGGGFYGRKPKKKEE